MSTRYQLHKDRLDAIANLGRDLTRRSKAKCELCSTSGERLLAMEVEPLPEQPAPEHSVFLCDTCSEEMANDTLDPIRWRFLESLVWSEIAPVQVTAVRLCRRLKDQGVSWAEDVLSDLYLSPEIEAWL